MLRKLSMTREIEDGHLDFAGRLGVRYDPKK